MNRFLTYTLFGFLFLTTAGCSWTDRNGTHHLIVGIGFGMITTTNRAGLEIYESQALGAQISRDGAGIGLMRHHRTIFDPAHASNLVVSINGRFLKSRVRIFDPNTTNKIELQETSR
jgi:hypothetical protein